MDFSPIHTAVLYKIDSYSRSVMIVQYDGTALTTTLESYFSRDDAVLAQYARGSRLGLSIYDDFDECVAHMAHFNGYSRDKPRYIIRNSRYVRI